MRWAQFSGDGRRVGSSATHTMVTVTMITGDAADRTPDAQLPLALLACGEDYDNVAKAFAHIAPEIADIKHNGFSEFHIATASVTTVWTSDWKFANCVLGLKAANADECCPWCSSTKAERQDPARAWSTNPTARINQRQLVQVDYVLVDLLHLLLRVGDQLVKQLIRDVISLQQAMCRTCARRKCAKKFCSCTCHAGRLLALTNAADDVGATLNFWASRNEATGVASGSVGWTSLRGPQKYKLLKFLDLHKVLPGSCAVATRSLWDKFMTIFDAANVRRVPTADEIANLENRTREFLADYVRPAVGVEVDDEHVAGGASIVVVASGSWNTFTLLL
eukprot:Unigene9636_Nuclearia_a/m.29446 Unigene9636_Nuclearia_a/g.29446  ORF Unigene9636_Nuclearia_a/g.29446 Unigene9636_Nuclearia_a/m.29446 type:complete len:335 (-) Unigene9636_Nuclearia_a:2-1006(-)